MTTVHFIRHGETDWNRERRIQGSTDVPLNDRGRAQALELAESLADRPIGAIWSSDLRRALDTARPLAERLGLEVRQTPALRERSFGVIEGRTDAEVAAELGHARETFWLDADARHDGGESRREVYDRVARFLDELLADPPAEEIALVSSGGAIRVGTAYLERTAVDAIVWGSYGNCSVTTVEV
jgi:broad specificity phosphatase PhoE